MSLFESLDAISWNFARTSYVAYANQLGTTSTVASIQGLLGGLTFGLGKDFQKYSSNIQRPLLMWINSFVIYAGFGVGSSGGSLLIGAYGQRVTFRILGGISFITGLFYFLFNFFYLRPKNTKTMDSAEAVNQNEMVSETISPLSSNGGSS